MAAGSIPTMEVRRKDFKRTPRSMLNFSKLILWTSATVLSSSCFGFTSISGNCVNAYHAAIAEANQGQAGRALATLNCLLMPHGISVGLGGSGEMSSSVNRSISVWGQRLPSSPFIFTDSSEPDLKVVLVPSIQRGGEVQGEVHCQRQMYWGSSGSRYRVKGTIFIRDNVDGRSLTRTEISSVIEHELGHVLGLEDDDDTSHLMGPFVPGRPVDGPCEEEVETVRSFRGAVADVVRQVSGRHGQLGSRGEGHRGHRSSYRTRRSS